VSVMSAFSHYVDWSGLQPSLLAVRGSLNSEKIVQSGCLLVTLVHLQNILPF